MLRFEPGYTLPHRMGRRRNCPTRAPRPDAGDAVCRGARRRRAWNYSRSPDSQHLTPSAVVLAVSPCASHTMLRGRSGGAWWFRGSTELENRCPMWSGAPESAISATILVDRVVCKLARISAWQAGKDSLNGPFRACWLLLACLRSHSENPTR